MADDGRKKRFREVLDPADEEKKSRTAKAPSDKVEEGEEKLSPLELAAEINVHKRGAEPTITSTRVFHQNENEDTSNLITAEETPTPSTPVTTEKPTVGLVNKKEEVQTSPKAVLEKQKGEKETSGSFDNNMAFTPAPQASIITPPASAPKMPEQVSSARETLLALAKAMVEKIELIKEPGKTETTLTLNHPPLFSGVQIKITELDTSQKQFNLTFSNFTNPDARALIDLASNQDKLRETLIAKGYTLQLITVEQKIPGLKSTMEFSELGLNQRQQDQERSGSATDDNEEA